MEPLGSNPYPGLRSFEPDEDHLFFGREKQIDELLRRLRKTRFLSVVGASGSGKSSVIRCGMIPALYSGMMTRAGSAWRIAILRPGDDPIGNLAEALVDEDVLGPEDPDLVAMHRSILETTLRASAVGLADAVRQAGLPEHENLLVVVDQFEELFRFKQNTRIASSRRDALSFVNLLLEGPRVEGVSIYVVITMRSDFIGNCMDFPSLPEAVNDGQYLIPRMNRDELRMAITGPAAVAGGKISPRLVRTLLNEVGDNPDQLPILQHALMRTWDYWQSHPADGEPVDLEHYQAIGTMREALSRHAEEAYDELATDRQREIAEKLFKALTDKGESGRGIRRPCRLDEVCEQVGATPEEVVEVADRFRQPGRSFLMPPAEVELGSESVLDISHESLMRVWTRLIEWLEEEGRSAQLYLRLSRAAARHEAGEGGLWREEELALARPWREKNQPNAAWARRYEADFDQAMAFLDESQKAREDFLAAREKERLWKLRRARIINWAVALGGLVVLFFASKMWRLSLEAATQSEIALTQKAYAEEQQAKARRLQEQAVSQQLEAEALREEAVEQRAEAEENRVKAEENQRRAQIERRRALEQERQALTAAEEARQAREQAERARAEAVASREQALEQKEQAQLAQAEAEEAQAEAQRLRRLAQFRSIVFQTLQTAHQNEEVSAVVSVQAWRLYRQLGSKGEDPHIFDVLRYNAERLGSRRWDTIAVHKAPVRALAVSADGATVASGGEDARVWLTPLGGPDSAALGLRVGRGGVRSLAYGADARRLAAGGAAGQLVLFDLAGGKPASRDLSGHRAAVTAVAFRPDAPVLASGSTDGDLRLWNLERLDRGSVQLASGGAAITSLGFRPGGELAAGSVGGGVRLVETRDLDRRDPERQLIEGDVRALDVSRDGRLLAVGLADNRILLFDLEAAGSLPTRLDGHDLSVNAVSLSPDGALLVSGSDDGSARLWDLARPALEPIVLAHGAYVTEVAFSPDGESVVTGSEDRKVSLWPTRSEQLVEEICRRVSRNLTRSEWSQLLPADSAYEPTCPNLPAG